MKWGIRIYPGMIFLLCLFLTPCGSLPQRDSRKDNDGNSFLYTSGHEYRAQIRKLKEDLIAMGQDVSDEDARLVAHAAVSFSMSLARDYHLTRPPLFHNLLVHLGIRKRGLCIHWAKDLIRHLRQLDQKSFQFYSAVAYLEFPLFTHSSIVVTARNQPFEEGIVLDPWRNSGRLYWAPVKTDTYPWQKWIL